MFTFATTVIEQLSSENRFQPADTRWLDEPLVKYQLARQLDTEYKLFETLHSMPHHINLFDMAICLSGRGNLQ